MRYAEKVSSIFRRFGFHSRALISFDIRQVYLSYAPTTKTQPKSRSARRFAARSDAQVVGLDRYGRNPESIGTLSGLAVARILRSRDLARFRAGADFARVEIVKLDAVAPFFLHTRRVRTTDGTYASGSDALRRADRPFSHCENHLVMSKF